MKQQTGKTTFAFVTTTFGRSQAVAALERKQTRKLSELEKKRNGNPVAEIFFFERYAPENKEKKIRRSCERTNKTLCNLRTSEQFVNVNNDSQVPESRRKWRK